MSDALIQRAAQLSQADIVKLLQAYETLTQDHQSLSQSHQSAKAQIDSLKSQLDWFKRQLFGRKSEKRLEFNPKQRVLEFVNEQDFPEPDPAESIKTYQRRTRKKKRTGDEVSESGLRFDDSVPMEEIHLPLPQDVTGAEYEHIGEKVTYKLAHRAASYVVIKYVRPVVKLKTTQKLFTAPMHAAVVEKSLADVSFLAGILIEKFVYHQPFYRQHQRLMASGIQISRSTLTQLAKRAIALLEMIYHAQLSNILISRVLAMDETPIKAERRNHKMKTAYFWPTYGEQDEVAFVFSTTRATETVIEVLNEFSGVLLTDGYAAYTKYAAKVDSVIHARCWTHARRPFLEGEKLEPERTQQALDYISTLYHFEKQIKEKGLTGQAKKEYRNAHSRPVVDGFFKWLKVQLNDPTLLPSNPFTKAVNYALEREDGLRVYLDDADVPMDTNHVERVLRPIPIGKKNWLFCWTELGAKQVGMIQSLLVTCKLHDINPYDYLVDVLQRIDQHPAKEVHLLTPRLWKENFGDNPIRSVIHKNSQYCHV